MRSLFSEVADVARRFQACKSLRLTPLQWIYSWAIACRLAVLEAFISCAAVGGIAVHQRKPSSVRCSHERLCNRFRRPAAVFRLRWRRAPRRRPFLAFGSPTGPTCRRGETIEVGVAYFHRRARPSLSRAAVFLSSVAKTRCGPDSRSRT